MPDRQGDGPTRAASPPRPRPALPWGFLGMVGLLILIEWTLAGHDLDFTAPWHWDWRTTGKLAARKQGKADILLFGDSLMKFGVMPKVVQDRSGFTAYNFGLHTGQTSSSYFMFRRVLEAGNHPRMVVLDLTPHMLAHDTAVNERLWPELLTPRESLDLASTMHSPDFFGATMLGGLCPSIKERHDIRATIYAWVKCLPSPSRRGEIPSYLRNWKRNQGAQLMPDGPSPPIDPVHWELSLYRRWAPDPVNVAYLNKFLQLAQTAQIPVYWLLPPNQPSILARTEASGYDADYTRFVQQVAGRYPGVTVVDARRSGFEPADFNDGIHLKRPGSIRLSAALGDLLRAGGANPRWVKLDPARNQLRDWPIEDVGQSALALQHDQGSARR